MSEYEIFKKSGEICIKHSNTEFAYYCEDNMQNTFTDQFHKLFSEDRLIHLDSDDIWKSLRRKGCFYHIEFDPAAYDTAVKNLSAEISASDNKYGSMIVLIEGDITLSICGDIIENICKTVSDNVNVIYSAFATDDNKVKVSVWAGI